MEGVGQHIVTKTKVRHILIKTNELIDDAEAQKRLLALRDRIRMAMILPFGSSSFR